MRDKISTERVAMLHPAVRNEVKNLIEQAESRLPKHIAIRVVEGLRTIEYQNSLYAKGRTKPGKIVTKAKGGSSYHNYGLAFDFALLEDVNRDGKFDILSWDIRKDNDRDGVADWLEVVKIFEQAGWFWGGKFSTFKDYPHLQKTFSLNWRELLRLYKAGVFIPGTKYVNI